MMQEARNASTLNSRELVTRRRLTSGDNPTATNLRVPGVSERCGNRMADASVVDSAGLLRVDPFLP